MKLTRVLRHSLAVTLFAASSLAQGEETFSDVYAFGDSLSDNGNLFDLVGEPGAPYWEGRFSNGPVWVEQLAEELGLDPEGIKDFAVGGSTTMNVLRTQVEPLISMTGGNLPPDALYVYWAGANDLLDLIAGGQGDPQTVIQMAMFQTASAIIALVQSGAGTVVVANLPNLSLTPRVVALDDPVASAGVEALASAYNQALAMVIQQLEFGFGLDIVEIDMFTLTSDIVANRKKYEFKKVDRPLIRLNGKLSKHPNRYLFFDDIHPTWSGHRVLMRAALQALGLPIPGDVNGDFAVNSKDKKALKKSLGFCDSTCPGDLNDDGVVDRTDRKILKGMLAKG
jgi:outer membrane lipase/esterase